MKNECSIIRDILPLYVEKLVSADTIAFVEEHLEKCAECRAELENMKKPNEIETIASKVQDNGTEPLKAIQKKWNKRKRTMMIGTAVATVLIVLIVSIALWSPVIFQRGNPIPFLIAASKISEKTPYIQVDVNNGASTVYISRSGLCPELLAYVSESRNVEFQEQGGSVYIFSNGVDTLGVTSEIYLGNYTVWEVPNKTLESKGDISQ